MGSLLAVLSPEGREAPDAIARMAEASPHRGGPADTASIGRATVAATSRPDSPDGWVAVGPDLAVAVSGVLDNRAELHEAWFPDGPGDPAHVVAAGIRREGVEAAARRMRGVFGVAVTDGRKLWAFRDHVGFHPLVYRQDAGGLFVGAEPKGVVAGAGVERKPDFDALSRLFFGAPEDMASAIAGVTRLPSATVLEGDGGRTALRRYWDPESLLEKGGVEPTEIRERFHGLMEQAVGRCLAGGDVVSLSGGVDSPAVAAFAAPIHRGRRGAPLPALSAVFPDHPSVDESRYVETVARELGLRLHTFAPKARPTDGLADWVRLFDGPVPIVAFGQVFEFLEVARELGFRNVLSGEIQEFVFEMRREVLPHLVARGRLVPALRHARARRARGDRAGKLARRAVAGVVPAGLRAGLRSIRRGSTYGLPPWVDAEVVERHRHDGAASWRADQLVAFGGSGLSLSADDTIQQVAGVRERRPFADVDLWEFALGLRAEVKHADPGPKALMRDLLRGTVPDLILDRRDKTVFDSYINASIDYRALRRWLVDPPGPPLPGVRYELLAARLEREEMTLPEFMWAKDLAGVHAFLSEWESG